MSQTNRISGGLTERNTPLIFEFNGQTFQAYKGDTLASALLANGVRLVGRSFKYHRPRGIFSAGSEEPNALVQLRKGAWSEPNTRATTVEVFEGLVASSLSEGEVAYAQDHLRILSGLYGLLRPLDAIQPYRLEMGSRLKTRRGASLYDYWRDDLSKALNAQAEATGSDIIVNCASQEYFGAVTEKALKPRVVTPVFMEDKGQGPKIVSFFAKRARGAMARHVIQNQVRDLDGLKAFYTDGYVFQPAQSDDARLVFVRPYPASSTG